MSTGSPLHSLITRPLSPHPTRPRLYSANSPKTQAGACPQATAHVASSRPQRYYLDYKTEQYEWVAETEFLLLHFTSSPSENKSDVPRDSPLSEPVLLGLST